MVLSLALIAAAEEEGGKSWEFSECCKGPNTRDVGRGDTEGGVDAVDWTMVWFYNCLLSMSGSALKLAFKLGILRCFRMLGLR